MGVSVVSIVNNHRYVPHLSLRKLFAAVGVIAGELAAYRLWLEYLVAVEQWEGFLNYSLILWTLLSGLVIVITMSHVVIGWSILALGFARSDSDHDDCPHPPTDTTRLEAAMDGSPPVAK